MTISSYCPLGTDIEHPFDYNGLVTVSVFALDMEHCKDRLAIVRNPKRSEGIMGTDTAHRVTVGSCPTCGYVTLLRVWKDGISRICQTCGDTKAQEFNSSVSAVINLNGWTI